MNANDRQIDGTHYKTTYEHWDFVYDVGLGYLMGCATKYISRHRKKNGASDLKKALHYLDKHIERIKSREFGVTADGVVRDTTVSQCVDATLQFGQANGLTVQEVGIVYRIARRQYAVARDEVARLLDEVYPPATAADGAGELPPLPEGDERQQQLYALERCIQGREAGANRMDEETGDPWASLGYREDTAQLVTLYEQLSQPATAADGAGEHVAMLESMIADHAWIPGVKERAALRAAIAALRQPVPDALVQVPREALELIANCLPLKHDTMPYAMEALGFAQSEARAALASQQESRNADAAPAIPEPGAGYVDQDR